MAEIINLNHFRKEAERKAKKSSAAANRLTFGRTKSEIVQTTKAQADVVRHLDGHKLTPKD